MTAFKIELVSVVASWWFFQALVFNLRLEPRRYEYKLRYIGSQGHAQIAGYETPSTPDARVRHLVGDVRSDD